MKMFVDYEPPLGKEAKEVSQVIREYFGYQVITKRKVHPELLTFNEDLGVYGVEFSSSEANLVYLTSNQIVSKDAKASEEFLFGWRSRTKNSVVIPLARLRGQSGEDTSEMKVSARVYNKRIRFLTIHEVGHFAVVKQYHFDENINSIFDQGPHCPDSLCIMYPQNLLLDLKLYPNYFCPTCLRNLRKYNPSG